MTSVQFTVTPTAASCAVCKNIVFTGTVTQIVSLRGVWVAHLKSGVVDNGTWGIGSTWNGTYHNVTTNQSGPMSLADLAEGPTGALSLERLSMALAQRDFPGYDRRWPNIACSVRVLV